MKDGFVVHCDDRRAVVVGIQGKAKKNWEWVRSGSTGQGTGNYVDVPIVAYRVLLRASARRSPGALGESEKGKKEGDSR